MNFGRSFVIVGLVSLLFSAAPAHAASASKPTFFKRLITVLNLDKDRRVANGVFRKLLRSSPQLRETYETEMWNKRTSEFRGMGRLFAISGLGLIGATPPTAIEMAKQEPLGLAIGFGTMAVGIGSFLTLGAVNQHAQASALREQSTQVTIDHAIHAGNRLLDRNTTEGRKNLDLLRAGRLFE